jgi:uncharacterized membrane protein YqjE
VDAASAGPAPAAPLEPPQADVGGAAAPGFVDNAVALWDDLKALAHDHLELAALETKRAGESLVMIVVFGIVAAILLVTAWMGLVAALVLWLVTLDLSVWLAVLIGVVVNVAAAGGLVFAIKSRTTALRFPATVRALKPGPREQHAAGDEQPVAS